MTVVLSDTLNPDYQLAFACRHRTDRRKLRITPKTLELGSPFSQNALQGTVRLGRPLVKQGIGYRARGATYTFDCPLNKTHHLHVPVRKSGLLSWHRVVIEHAPFDFRSKCIRAMPHLPAFASRPQCYGRHQRLRATAEW